MSTGVTAIAAGFYHTCAVQNGAAKCLGSNERGQLGDSSNSGKFVPTQVTGLDADTTLISARTNHTCAVHAGSVKCWGYNILGQLGDGTSTQRTAPVVVKFP